MTRKLLTRRRYNQEKLEKIDEDKVSKLWNKTNYLDKEVGMLTNNRIYEFDMKSGGFSILCKYGKLTPDEAREDPRKNLITRALGVTEDLKIDFCEEEISENDVLLICTDGLTNYVTPEEIYKLTEDGKFYEFAERLVNCANHNGGGDNVTVVTVAY